MTLRIAEIESQQAPASVSNRTHPRVQVVSLGVCVAASSAFVAALHLPWFGPFVSTESPEPQYSALSGSLAPPSSPAGLVPGTQNWGYLLVAWSVLLIGLAVAAALACTLRHFSGDSRGLGRALFLTSITSLLLVAIVIAEVCVTVPYDQTSMGFSWGAIIGLGLALIASFGAWLAWATWTFPRCWGIHPLTD